MGRRRKGRELALKLLYQIEITGNTSSTGVEFALGHFEGGEKSREFARRLVQGVLEKGDEIDRMIEQCSEHWKLHRMARVDLAILRMGAFELLYCPDIPASVSIDEAVEVAKRYGSGDSASFINGILDHIAASVGVKELR